MSNSCGTDASTMDPKHVILDRAINDLKSVRRQAADILAEIHPMPEVPTGSKDAMEPAPASLLGVLESGPGRIDDIAAGISSTLEEIRKAIF